MIMLRQSLSVIARLCTIVIIGAALELQPAHPEEIPDPRIKRVYTDEDAPPEIRFMQLLNTLTVKIDGSRDLGPGQLEALGVKPEDIPAIRAYLESLYGEAQAEIDEGIWRVACHSDAETLGGLEIRVVYNSLDDLRYAVFAKYLAIASAELASKGYPDFLYMIDGYPGPDTSFKVMSTDHRYAWGDTNDWIQQNRARFCQGIDGRVGKHAN